MSTRSVATMMCGGLGYGRINSAGQLGAPHRPPAFLTLNYVNSQGKPLVMTTIPSSPAPDEPRTHTHACHIGRSYEYLCQVGNTFTYSHQPFGKIVWHRGHA